MGGEKEKIIWPTREYTIEGPAKEFMTINDVCSYFVWSRGKLRRIIREDRAFPRARNVPGRGQGWWGRDIAAYQVIADIYTIRTRKKKGPPQKKGPE